MFHLDFQIFDFINHDLSNSFFDWLAPIMRDKKTWIPLYIFLIAWIVWRYKKHSWLIILIAGATVGISDYTSSSIIKPLIKRVRPCNDKENSYVITSRVSCGSGYSFPSSHASNHFALAFFLSLTVFKRNPWIKLLAFVWASLISLSQVYVGVHYPVDIFGGACLGMLIAFATFALSLKLWPEYIISIER